MNRIVRKLATTMLSFLLAAPGFNPASAQTVTPPATGSSSASSAPTYVTQRVPTVTDDVTKGYAVGNLWNTRAGLFVNQQNAAGNARWTASTVAALPCDVLSTAPVACFGTKRQRRAYAGNAFNLRRASDGTQADIAFLANNYPDVAAANAFCANTTCGYAIWYDQSVTTTTVNFTVGISGNVATVSAVSSGALVPGGTLSCGTAGLVLWSQLTGTTGSTGTYTVSIGGQSVAGGTACTETVANNAFQNTAANQETYNPANLMNSATAGVDSLLTAPVPTVVGDSVINGTALVQKYFVLPASLTMTANNTAVYTLGRTYSAERPAVYTQMSNGTYNATLSSGLLAAFSQSPPITPVYNYPGAFYGPTNGLSATWSFVGASMSATAGIVHLNEAVTVSGTHGGVTLAGGFIGATSATLAATPYFTGYAELVSVIFYAAAPPAPAATFTGSITGNTLTVTAVSSGTLSVGDYITFSTNAVLVNTQITALGTGTGGVGTYTLNNTQTVASSTLYDTNAVNNPTVSLLRQSLALSYGLAPQIRDVCGFDGDSITEGYQSVYLQNRVRQVMALINRPCMIYNKGYYGDTMAHRVTNYPADVAPLYNPTATNNVLEIFAGTNDNDGTDTTGTAIYANMTAYVALAHATGFKVLTATMLPRSAFTANQIAEQLAFNALVRANSAGADGVIDYASDPTMGLQATASNTTYYADGIHPTMFGYGLLAPIEAAAFNKVMQ